jgi:hypothetical protein
VAILLEPESMARSCDYRATSVSNRAA